MKTATFKKSALLAAALFTLLGFSFSAHAKVKFRVKNCAGEKMLVCVFDGKDKDYVFEADFARIKDGDKASMKCAGQGKGGCKVRATSMSVDICNPDSTGSGIIFDGRHKGYFLLHGDDGNSDLEEVSESVFKADNACD